MQRVGILAVALWLVLLGSAPSGLSREQRDERQDKKGVDGGAGKAQHAEPPDRERSRQREQRARQLRQREQSRQQQRRAAQQRQIDENRRRERARQQPGVQEAPRVQEPPLRALRAQTQRTPQQVRAQQREQQETWRLRRATNWEAEHRTWQQRGGYNADRVPDAYFRSHYGPGRAFRVYGLPFMVVGGYPRFQNGGYWFSLVDPYPEFWGRTWYLTDDVFVESLDSGYYLFNRRYPDRPGVAISVSY